jgi:hypothetical protein
VPALHPRTVARHGSKHGRSRCTNNSMGVRTHTCAARETYGVLDPDSFQTTPGGET